MCEDLKLKEINNWQVSFIERKRMTVFSIVRKQKQKCKKEKTNHLHIYIFFKIGMQSPNPVG